MTRRPKALVGTAIIAIAVLTGTQVNARTKQKNNPQPIQDHQHSIGSPSYDPQHQQQVYRPRRVKSEVSPVKARVSSFANRDCLDGPTRALLDKLEARFGRVALVKVCVPGARMPSGHLSWHAKRKAFDFNVPKGIDQRDVMVWLTKHSPGVTISYRGALAGIVHTDTGPFHKVIYNAENHEAGEKAVAIWQERAMLASLPPVLTPTPLPRPRPEMIAAPVVLASLGDDPMLDDSVTPTLPLRPEPIGPADRRDIFRRYFESKDVVVRPHVTLAGVDRRLVRLVNDASSHFGRTAYINSGYRSPSYNRRVGGARNSEHMKGRAVDFRVAGVSPWELRGWIVGRLDRWAVRGIGTYGSHVHADVRAATKLVTWTGGKKKRVTRYAKHRKPGRYAAAG